MAKIPPVSKKQVPKFVDSDHRQRGASSFTRGAGVYHEIRPHYPLDVLRLLSPARRVLDVGAGTGKLTEQLIGDGRFEQVYALDPSADMLRVLAAHVSVAAWRATAEHTASADGLFDAVTCAQTWHWVDPMAASAEFARITSPDGQALLVWNTLDVTVPWVHRLTRIMHSGDTLAAGFYPQMGSPWHIAKEHRSMWLQRLSVAQVHQLMQSRSYWLRSSEKVRVRMSENLRWYLEDHLGYQPDMVVELPYRCDGFLLEKRQ